MISSLYGRQLTLQAQQPLVVPGLDQFVDQGGGGDKTDR